MVDRYSADAVAMGRYLVDRLPSAAQGIFERAEDGVDTLEAPPITVAETMDLMEGRATVAGVETETTGQAVLRGLVHEGPVEVAPFGEHDLAVMGSLLDHYSLHDAMLIASHRVRGTEAIISNDGEFAGEATVWD